MTLPEIFDVLLTERTVALQLAAKSQAESLRVSLVRKFSNYKNQMSALGFLDSSYEGTVCSLEWNQESKVATFYFRAKLTRPTDYEIVKIVTKQNAET